MSISTAFVPRLAGAHPVWALSDAETDRSQRMSTSPAYQTFLYKIATLRRLLDRYSSDDFTARSGLTLAEWRVLTVLYSSSPTTSRQVCQHLRADKAEISRACAGLAKRRCVSITKDTSDRRRAFVAITPRGKRLHDRLMPLRMALQRELEAAMTRKEIADLTRILDKLILYASKKIGAERPRSAG